MLFLTLNSQGMCTAVKLRKKYKLLISQQVSLLAACLRSKSVDWYSFFWHKIYWECARQSNWGNGANYSIFYSVASLCFLRSNNKDKYSLSSTGNAQDLSHWRRYKLQIRDVFLKMIFHQSVVKPNPFPLHHCSWDSILDYSNNIYHACM